MKQKQAVKTEVEKPEVEKTEVEKTEVVQKEEDTGRLNIKKVLIVRDLRDFHNANIVNMAEKNINKRSDVAINK